MRLLQNCNCFKSLSLSSHLEWRSLDHGGLSVEHISKHSLFHGTHSQDHGRLAVEHTSKLSIRKTCTHVSDSLVRTAENGAGARPTVLTPVLSPAKRSSPHHRRFHTGQTPEKLARMCRLLDTCLKTLLRNWHTCGIPCPCFKLGENREKLHTCWTPLSMSHDTLEKLAHMLDPWPEFCNSNDEKNIFKLVFGLSLSGSLGAWEKSQDVKTSVASTRDTTT